MALCEPSGAKWGKARPRGLGGQKRKEKRQKTKGNQSWWTQIFISKVAIRVGKQKRSQTPQDAFSPRRPYGKPFDYLFSQ